MDTRGSDDPELGASIHPFAAGSYEWAAPAYLDLIWIEAGWPPLCPEHRHEMVTRMGYNPGFRCPAAGCRYVTEGFLGYAWLCRRA